MLLFLQKRLFSTVPVFDCQSSSFNDILSDSNSIYIDKTRQIAQIMIDKERLIYFNRPRRLGKSFILGGLEYFYNTRLQEEDSIKCRELKIFSSTPFGKDLGRNEEFLKLKNKLASENYVALQLDFSTLKDYAIIGKFQEGLYKEFKSSIKYILIRYDSHLNEIIKTTLKKSLETSNLADIFKSLIEERINLVLLIDEYESPMMDCLDPDLKQIYHKLQKDYNSFFSNLKAARKKALRKCVMTGVISLRNISAFSDANSFANRSLSEIYREAFGFTMTEIKEDKQVQQFFDHILTSTERRIPSDLQKLNKQELKKYFIDKFFEKYNGFKFTPKSFKDGISLISPISIVNHMMYLEENPDANPFFFNSYWSYTGSTSKIKSLCINNVDPTESYEVLNKAKIEPLNLNYVMQAQSINDNKFFPLNLLLFNTGYFTLKTVSEDMMAELDWTNQEAKDDFFKHYVNNLNFKIEDLFSSLKISKPNWSMKEFVEKLNSYFDLMLKTYYKDGDNLDHEQNHSMNFYMEILEYLPRNIRRDSDYVVYHQIRLIEESEENLSKGMIPDLLFIFSDYENKLKHIIFLEFYKKGKESYKKDHRTKSQRYPQIFLKSQLMKSLNFINIKGNIEEMHVLVIGYELKAFNKKYFSEIIHYPFEVQNKNGHYSASLIEGKNEEIIL